MTPEPHNHWLKPSAAAVLALALAALVFPGRSLTAPLPDTVALKDMTWVEVRSAIAAGFSTVIVPTGGIEQNGPQMILGKHDYIVTAAATRIAAGLGHTLVAPVVSFVPQGEYDPPTAHLRFPGTIGVSGAAFEGLLDGIARSLKTAGFTTIVFIGDHGPSQAPQAAVASRLTAEWSRQGVRVVQIGAYYDDKPQYAKLKAGGLSFAEIGIHAGLIDTSELLSVNPAGVKLSALPSPSPLSEATGASGNPAAATPALGATLLDMRIAAAVEAIKALPATK